MKKRLGLFEHTALFADIRPNGTYAAYNLLSRLCNYATMHLCRGFRRPEYRYTVFSFILTTKNIKIKRYSEDFQTNKKNDRKLIYLSVAL